MENSLNTLSLVIRATFVIAHANRLSQHGRRMLHERRFVALAAMRQRSKKRRIRFHQQAITRNDGRYFADLR